jgi:hypothetical protein
MRSIFLALALVVGVGCNKAQKELEQLEKRACACTDEKCANVVTDDLMAWAHDHKDDSVSNEDDLKTSLTNTVECILKSGGDAMSLRTKLMSIGN